MCMKHIFITQVLQARGRPTFPPPSTAPFRLMSIGQKVEQVNRLHNLIEHRPVPLRGGDGEPASPTGNPNPNLTVIVLAVGKVTYIVEYDALRKVIRIEN
jgi:hypothetical protein